MKKNQHVSLWSTASTRSVFQTQWNELVDAEKVARLDALFNVKRIQAELDEVELEV
jgi:hypothetical protein